MDAAIGGSTQTMTLPPMAMLAKKMASIMGKLQRLNQGGTNQQGWTFTSIDDITDAIRSLMSEFGIALFSKMTRASEVKDGKTTRATVEMEFELVCADTGFSKVMTWTGSAEDYSDKALNKAAVYAEKFWLKSTFLVSTGKDPDSKSPGLDKRREQPRQQRPPEQPKQAAGRQVDMATGEVLSNGQQKPDAPNAEQPEPHFSDDDKSRQVLINTAIKCGYLTEGQTWADLLRLAELTDVTVRKFATGNDLGKHVKEKGEALKTQLASAQISGDKARESLNHKPGRSVNPPPPLTGEAKKPVEGGAVAGASPFDMNAPQVNPDTGVLEHVNGKADYVQPPF